MKPTYEQLEQQLAAVVAENAGLKQAITTHSQSTHFCEVCGKDDPCSTDDVCYVLNETPATDVVIANIQAQGVEMFAHSMAHHLLVMEKNGEDAITKIQVGTASRLALAFAAQLRQGVEHE
ncbi:TPA: hypothetical protein R0C45_003903 [Kluyvera ascorbata F0526]|nr:hypothetical protein [Kluyvera ascorbata F0526]